MTDPNTIVDHLVALIEERTGLTVYDGNVPSKVPESGGYIESYVVLWAGTGDDVGEVTADGMQVEDITVFDFQTTAVGATPSIARSVGHGVNRALTNARVQSGRVRPSPDGFSTDRTIPDTTVTPSRHMLPAQWRLITN
ncbi:hypothetical protein C6401_15205 [Arthrobacter woluwensis]|uniref:hypothetical protein n=1 Tax=Arthrobacter woluwensis TaxID=156980 RepID=UPI000D122145|nr:hypothetical protein [Arthrobacter woluwensis]PSS42905.1 hypothetical protein C6401_15205 [Arthrobacter woluwensis]